MIIIGITGGIGMGKSTLAAQFSRFGAKISNADDIVHRLLSTGGAAVEAVRQLFPSVIRDGAVDRKALGDIVFHDKAKLKRLEHILHPLVIAEEKRFVLRQKRRGARLVVMDIPLLFETGADKRCDITIVASAPFFIQKQRVMARPGMTEEKFHRIVRSQMPESEKHGRADFVIPTGLGKGYSLRKVAGIVKGLTG